MYHLQDQYRNPVNMHNTKSMGTLIGNMASMDMRTPAHRQAPTQGQRYGKNNRPEYARFKLAAYFRGSDTAHSPYPSYDTHDKYIQREKYTIVNEERGLNYLMTNLVERLQYKNTKPYKGFAVFAAMQEDISLKNKENHNYAINYFKDGRWQWPEKRLIWHDEKIVLDIVTFRRLDWVRTFEANRNRFQDNGKPRFASDLQQKMF